MTNRQRLQALVEDLPESELHAALRFVEYLSQSSAGSLDETLRNAPLDDEPLTAEDLAALDEAEDDVREGRLVSHEEARRRLLG